jgi:hypothetical protein
MYKGFGFISYANTCQYSAPVPPGEEELEQLQDMLLAMIIGLLLYFLAIVPPNSQLPKLVLYFSFSFKISTYFPV